MYTRITTCLTLGALISGFAQTTTNDTTLDDMTIVTATEAAPIPEAAAPEAAPMGSGAIAPVVIAKSNSWKNWTFAGVSAITLAGAIYFISLNNGHDVPDSR